MHVVVFAPYAIPTPHFETDLELIQRHVDAGDQVTMLACTGELPACDSNPYRDLSRCLKCRARRRAGVAALPASVRIESFLRLTPENEEEGQRLRTEFANVEDLKRYHIDGFDAGYAVLSSLIGICRDPEPDFQKYGPVLAELLRAGWMAYRSMENYLRENAVDRVYLFNGRFAPLRAVLRACQEAGVECFTHERGASIDLFALFRNTTPHDRTLIEAEIQRTWDEAAEDPEREAIARQWYEGRAKGSAPPGQLVFTGNQRPDALPDNWDASRHNVAIYISSEDEFVAIGESWRNPLYDDQLDGLKKILASLQSDPGKLHLYLRIHPNLAKLDNSQTRGLAALAAPCLTVIPARAPIDTYALMRSASVVLSFGSTAGAEAVYWGRPSILAGHSFYENLGGTYNPRSHEELMDLLRAPLEPKPRDGILRYGFHFATRGEPFRYFMGQGYYAGRFKGRRLRPTVLENATIALADTVSPRRLLRRATRALRRPA